MTPAACPHCGCNAGAGAPAHALLALLAMDAVDAALDAGLLEAEGCGACPPACNARLDAAAQARRTALAARERHRARTLRLARRKAEREAARSAPLPRQADASAHAAPALPSAAADALARALAKARDRRA